LESGRQNNVRLSLDMSEIRISNQEDYEYEYEYECATVTPIKTTELESFGTHQWYAQTASTYHTRISIFRKKQQIRKSLEFS